jgi:hypothetical protein
MLSGMQLTLCVLFYQGIDDLMHDNKTEHLRTINILERFNIYQEVILAVLYKLSPLRVSTITCVACMVVVIKTHIYGTSRHHSAGWLAGTNLS